MPSAVANELSDEDIQYSMMVGGHNKPVDEFVALLIEAKEQPGARCLNGGIKVAVGLDTNVNFKLDDHEIDYVEYVCNQ
jgi:hypothetical protein